MAVETLRPNAAGDAAAHSVTGTNNFTALNDNSDTTYLRNNTGTLLEDDLNLGASALTTETLSNPDIRVRARSETTAAGQVTVGYRLGGVNSLGTTITGISTSATDFTVSGITRPGGGSWAVSDLANLQIVVQSNDTTAAAVRIFEVYADINYSTTVTTTKTETGVARIQKAVAQTIAGLSRITATTLRTITGLGRVQKAAIQTITGKGRITKSVAQTIGGLGRITASTLRTIAGLARITKSVTQTVSGKARIQKAATQTQTGVGRITNLATQSIMGVARITKTATQTINGKARIQKAVTQNISGVANILTSPDTEYSWESLSVLPTDAVSLANSYSPSEVTDTQTLDLSYVDATGSDQFIVHLFRDKMTGSETSLGRKWTGRITHPTSSSSLYLQIYNFNSSTWETIDTDGSSASPVTLNGFVNTNISDYFDVDFVTAWRVYQEVG